MKKYLHMLAVVLLAFLYPNADAYSRVLKLHTTSLIPAGPSNYGNADNDQDGKTDHDHDHDGKGDNCDDDEHDHDNKNKQSKKQYTDIIDSDEDGKNDHDHNHDGIGDGCDDKEHKGDDPKHEPGQSCAASQPRPITGDQHPCPGDIEYYSIDNTRGYTSFVWDVPRAQDGNPPAGWLILEGQGTNRVKVRVGEKSGTMKVKVTDPECGTKVATLPIKPGKNFEVTITGPNRICVDEVLTYKATVTRDKGKGNGQVKGEFLYTWSVPADWQIVQGQGTAEIQVKAGATDGDVSVTVKDNTQVSGNGNNGNGVGGYKQGYCGTASDRVRVITRDNCGTPPTCPRVAVTVAGPDSVCAFQDEPVTYTGTTTGTTDNATFVWQVPADWEILSGQGTTAIQVQIGSETGQVSLAVSNTCGSSATGTTDVFVDQECGALTPLPVELISFEGEATKTGILLEWATATEKNNDHFEVERSADGKSFARIGEVKGNGTTSLQRRYSLRDARASRGTHYYRLKQVDFDGKFEYSKTIVVENSQQGLAASLLVAPNPANGQFTIALENAETAQLQILDINGRLLHTQSLNQGARELSFNTNSLGMRSGLYVISIKSATNSSQAKLVVR